MGEISKIPVTGASLVSPRFDEQGKEVLGLRSGARPYRSQFSEKSVEKTIENTGLIKNLSAGDTARETALQELQNRTIDASMISSLLTSVFNKLDASNLKSAAEKIANVEVRNENTLRERNKQIDEQVAARTEEKKKQKESQLLQDIGLGISTALAVLSFIALGFVTGGVGFAIAGAAITAVMSGMEIANRAIKDDPNATYTDPQGQQKRLDISLGGMVNRIVEHQAASGQLDGLMAGMTDDQKEKFLNDWKMGWSITASIAVAVAGVVAGAGAAKAGINAVKDATGIAAKAIMANKALIQTGLEVAEAVGQVGASIVEGINAGVQLQMAEEVKRGRTAENKAQEYNFQAEILANELAKTQESMKKHSESVKSQIETMKAMLDALTAMDDRVIHI